MAGALWGSNMNPYFVLIGTLSTGYHAAGPFPTYMDAQTFVERFIGPNHAYIFELHPPTDYTELSRYIVGDASSFQQAAMEVLELQAQPFVAEDPVLFGRFCDQFADEIEVRRAEIVRRTAREIAHGG